MFMVITTTSLKFDKVGLPIQKSPKMESIGKSNTERMTVTASLIQKATTALTLESTIST
jgi:hypothetical protein